MASTKTKLKCGKCGLIYHHEENLGTLNCFDRYYSSDLKHSFFVRADHRQSSNRKTNFSVYDWMDWCWTMEDCVFIEKSRLKKIHPQPDKLAVVDIEEFNHKHRMYIEGSIEDDIKKEKKTAQLFTIEHKIDEGLSDYEYDSFDDNSYGSDEEDEDEMNNKMCDGIVKQVCIARFDWREKFRVLLQIKKLDNEIQLSDFRPIQLFPYSQTIEFKSNHSIRRKYFELGFH